MTTVERVHGSGCGCVRCQGTPKGNSLRETHGSYLSDAKLSRSPRVAELAAWIGETQPVSHPADEGSYQRLALTYHRIERSSAALDEADEFFGGKPLAMFTEKAMWLSTLREDHARWIREAGRIEAELGRTPASRAKLGLHLALGRKALTVVEMHEAAALELVDGDDAA